MINNHMFLGKRKIGLTLAAFVLLLGLGVYVSRTSEKYFRISDVRVKYETADTKNQRRTGLGGRQSLNQDSTMLFIFPTSSQHGIWMKDMNFPIDIIWLDANKKVVHIESHVSPETYPTTFTPTEPAKYVLETNAGFVDENSITIGDTAEF